MVPEAAASSNGPSSTASTRQEDRDSFTRQGEAPLPRRQTQAHGLPLVRTSLQAKGASQRAQEIILSGWREGTRKQYLVYLEKWLGFCADGTHDPISSSVEVVLDFLTSLFDDGLGYSAINTTRSALSVW